MSAFTGINHLILILQSEKASLDARKARLKSFMEGRDFETVGETQQLLLTRQEAAMENYSAILGERIDDLEKRQLKL